MTDTLIFGPDAFPDAPQEPIIDTETYAPLIFVRTPPVGDNPYWGALWVSPIQVTVGSWYLDGEDDDPLYTTVEEER